MWTLVAKTAFGLEAVVKRELEHLGATDLVTRDGRIQFAGDAGLVARANLWLRASDRVLIQLAEFKATDFGQLFDQTKAFPWEDWLPEDARFPVQGRSTRSKLHSVPDCQRLVKKAIVERLKTRFRRQIFPETGALYSVEVSLNNDIASLTIDTTGPGLHKRGYRTWTGEAPLRETLAAGLIQLTYWNPTRPFIDPFCGTGTFPIEAVLWSRNIAPGINRQFAAELWPQIPAAVWASARDFARRSIRPHLDMPLVAADADAGTLELARKNARQAGVLEDIEFQQRSLSQFSTSQQFGCIVTNPPWGHRLAENFDPVPLAQEMARKFTPLNDWSIYILTADRQFETHFGRKADRRRKLFNGPIETTFYQFLGPPPPDRPEVSAGSPDSASPGVSI